MEQKKIKIADSSKRPQFSILFRQNFRDWSLKTECILWIKSSLKYVKKNICVKPNKIEKILRNPSLALKSSGYKRMSYKRATGYCKRYSYHSFYVLLNLYWIELVSKELNHLAAILHAYARGLNFLKQKKILLLFFQKENGNTYFYTFNHFYSEKSSKRAK